MYKATDFIETGKTSHACLSRTSTICLMLAFAFLFFPIIGGVMSYASSRDCHDLPKPCPWSKDTENKTACDGVPDGSRPDGSTCFEDADITMAKWVGFLAGVGLYAVCRVLASCMAKTTIHIGVPFGGSARGSMNPHGGASPFYIKTKLKQAPDQIVQLIRTAKRASGAGIALSDYNQSALIRSESGGGTVAEEKEEKAMKEKRAAEAAKARVAAIPDDSRIVIFTALAHLAPSSCARDEAALTDEWKAEYLRLLEVKYTAEEIAKQEKADEDSGSHSGHDHAAGAVPIGEQIMLERGDGKVLTDAEAVRWKLISEIFASADEDGDGSLSVEVRSDKPFLSY